MTPLDSIKNGIAKGHRVEITLSSTQQHYEVIICSPGHVEKLSVAQEELPPGELGKLLWKK